MFSELLPLLKDRMLMLTIASIGDESLRVNVIPQWRPGKESDTAENALTSPLTITGSAEELDREFATQITGYRASLDQLKSNLGEIEAVHATALKAVEEERKKELSSKRKASATSAKPGARTEVASPSTNGKPMFGGKSQSDPSPTTPSLFDSGLAVQSENRPEAKAEPLIATPE